MDYFDHGIKYSAEFLGNIGNVDVFATLLTAAVPFLLGDYVCSGEKRDRWLLLPAAFGLFIAVESGVASAKAGLAAGFLLGALVLLQKKRLKRLGIAAIVVAATAALAMAGMEFEFRGEKLPRPLLMKYAKSDDRDTRRECYAVLGGTLGAHAAELDRIYDSLVHVRDRMAKKMGYRNFVELGYYRMTAVLTGQSDVGLAGPEACIYVLNQEKADYPVVFGQLTKRDGSFLVGRSNEAFSWENLRGKTVIGGRAGGVPEMTLEYVLRKNGLTPGKDVTVDTTVQFNMREIKIFGR